MISPKDSGDVRWRPKHARRFLRAALSRQGRDYINFSPEKSSLHHCQEVHLDGCIQVISSTDSDEWMHRPKRSEACS